MNAPALDQCIDLLRRQWRALVGVAVLALVPVLVATALIDVLRADASAIVNGRLVPTGTTSSWTVLRLTATVGDVDLRISVPTLLVLGWVGALAVSLRILAGAPLRAAWPQAGGRAGSWLPLGALSILLTLAGFFLSVLIVSAFSGGLGAVVAVVVGVFYLYGLARLAIALPVMLIDGCGLVDAVRRAVAVTRGRVRRNGTLLIVAGIGLPTTASLLAHAVAEGLASRAGGSWVGDVLWVGAGLLVENLALVAVVPVQAVVLMAAHRAAIRADGTPEAATGAGARKRWLAAAGLAFLVAVPAAVTSAVVLANPNRVPVATVTQVSVLSSQPLALSVLADGTTATADDMQVGVCYDARCTDYGFVSLPCRDGAAMTPVSAGVGCASELPPKAADFTTDGTLVAFARGHHQDARLFWCRVSRDQMCQWGGATTLLQLPALWESWSMSIVATPTGGFAATMVGPGKDGQHGQLLLITCERLNCPQPTVRGVLDVPLPDVWHGGIVDIAVDPASGSLALGYYDTTANLLWLGGCSAGCEGGPALTQAGVWPPFVHEAQSLYLPSLDVAATAAGPVAVVTAPTPPDGSDVAGGTEVTTVIDCDDLACTASHNVGSDGWTSAQPAVDSAGAAFVVVASPAPGARPALLNVRTGAQTVLVGEGDVVAATFGPDDRLRTILHGPQGLSLVTCAAHHCTTP